MSGNNRFMVTSNQLNQSDFPMKGRASVRRISLDALPRRVRAPTYENAASDCENAMAVSSIGLSISSRLCKLGFRDVSFARLPL
jgi:hypothetical protein